MGAIGVRQTRVGEILRGREPVQARGRMLDRRDEPLLHTINALGPSEQSFAGANAADARSVPPACLGGVVRQRPSVLLSGLWRRHTLERAVVGIRFEVRRTIDVEGEDAFVKRAAPAIVLLLCVVLSACGAQTPDPTPPIATWDSAEWNRAVWAR